MEADILPNQIARLMLHNAPVLMALHDTDNNIVWANSAYLKATGLSLKELQNRKCYMAWGVDGPCPNCPVHRAIETGEPAVAELTPSPSGPWLVKAAPIRDETCAITGAVTVALESAELEKHERRGSDHSLERVMASMRSIGDALIITDVEGRVEVLNCEAQRLTGWSTDEARGRPLGDVFRVVDENSHRPVAALVDKVLQDGKGVGMRDNVILIARNGTELPIVMGALPVEAPDGTLSGAMLVFRDQAEKRAMERTLKRRVNELSALSSVTTGILEADNTADLLSHVLDDALRVIDIYSGAVYLLNRDTNILEAVVCRGLQDRLVRHTAKFKVGEGVIGKAAQTGAPALFRDLNEYYPEHVRTILAQSNIQSGIAVPLRGSTGVIGVMYLAAGKPNYFDAARIEMLTGLGRQVAIGIENLRLFEALRETEARFRTLVEQSADCILTMDAAGKVTYASPASIRILGYAPDEVVGRNVFDFVSPEDMDTVLQVFRQVTQRSGWSKRVECRMRHRFGAYRWVEAVFTNALNEPAVKNVVLNFHDITKRKRKEDEVRFERECLQTVLGNIPVMITMYETTGKVLFLNREFERVTGWSREDADKISLMEALFPDPQYREEVRQFMLSPKPEWRDMTLTTRQGDVVETTWTNVRLSDGSQIGIGVDLSEIRAAEQTARESKQRFELVVSRLNDVVWIATADGRTIIDVNHAFAKVFGVPGDRFRCNPDLWLEMVHPDDRPIVEASTKQLCTTGHAEVEYRIVRPDGEVRWIRDRRSVILDEQGRPLQIAGIANDITEIKQQEAERERLEAQLAQAQKLEAIGRFAGGIAHDFNNMLSVIMAHAELALRKLEPSDKFYSSFEAIREAAKRSGQLTHQLLAFAHKQTVNPQVVDLNEIVEQMLDMLQRLIGENIEITWKPGTNLWPVKVDPAQVDQILANLTVNARDAIEGHGRVTIETENVTLDATYCSQHPDLSPGHYVMLTVSDTGSGMDKETLDKIFEPFFTTKEPGKGTGLGLATIYGIVKQNGGGIHVYSEPGHGTIFRIYLPRHSGPTGARASQLEEESPKGQGETVLLVEDEPEILKVGRRFLEDLGYSALVASGPREAIEIAQRYTGKIDLLLTDVIMPEMNGRELSDRIAALHSGIKIALMSGYTDDVVANHGGLDRDITLIPKPLDLKQLAFKLRELLERE